MMLKGLQTHFKGVILGSEKCKKIADIGVQLGRIDGQQEDPQLIADQVGELSLVGIKSYVMISKASQISTLPKTIFGCQYLNEPDGRIYPLIYRAGFLACAIEAEKYRIDLYGPCVSNIMYSKPSAFGKKLRGIDYIKAIGPLPPSAKGSIHRYGDDDDVTNPHRGFQTRTEEVEVLRSSWGPRPWGVSEGGWASTDGMSEEEAGYNIEWEMDFWAEMMALFYILYQIHDGPSAEAIDNFGLFRVDGTIKESFARAFK